MKKENIKSTFVLASVFTFLSSIALLWENSILSKRLYLSFVSPLEIIIIFLIGAILLRKKVDITTILLLSACAFIDAFDIINIPWGTLFWDAPSMFRLISSILLAIFAILSCAAKNNKVFKLWFLPVIFSLLNSYTVYVFFHNQGFYYIDSFGMQSCVIIAEVINCLRILFLALSLKEFSKIKQPAKKFNVLKNPIDANTGYCNMTTHVLLLIFTGLIWGYVWIYTITTFLNRTQNAEKRNPTKELLLCAFLPFYYIYWIYKSSHQIETLAHEKSIDSDIVTVSTILSLFVWIAPVIIMQNKLNQISNPTISTPKVETIISNIQNHGDKTNEIRNYKELLKEGIITEEEFEAKKKQLLGL